MKKAIEDIKSLVEDRQTKKNELIKKYKREHAEITAKIKELEAAQKDTMDLDAYKAINADLKEQREFLAFLETAHKRQNQSVITTEEKKSITQTIDKEIDDIQNKYAPELIKKLADLIKDMDAYTAEVTELEDLMMQVGALYAPAFPGSYCKASDIGSKNTSPVEWLQRFVYMYYSYVNTAQAIENHSAGKWGRK